MGHSNILALAAWFVLVLVNTGPNFGLCVFGPKLARKVGWGLHDGRFGGIWILPPIMVCSCCASQRNIFFSPVFFTFPPQKAHFLQFPSHFPHMTFQSLGFVMKRAAAFRICPPLLCCMPTILALDINSLYHWRKDWLASHEKGGSESKDLFDLKQGTEQPEVGGSD